MHLVLAEGAQDLLGQWECKARSFLPKEAGSISSGKKVSQCPTTGTISPFTQSTQFPGDPCNALQPFLNTRSRYTEEINMIQTTTKKVLPPKPVLELGHTSAISGGTTTEHRATSQAESCRAAVIEIVLV